MGDGEAAIAAGLERGVPWTGCLLVFEKITVTGTENILMAAALAEAGAIVVMSGRRKEVLAPEAEKIRWSGHLCAWSATRPGKTHCLAFWARAEAEHLQNQVKNRLADQSLAVGYRARLVLAWPAR